MLSLSSLSSCLGDDFDFFHSYVLMLLLLCCSLPFHFLFFRFVSYSYNIYIFERYKELKFINS